MNPETLKRLPSYLLAGGASLTFGLLSLGGLFALAPIWPLAIGAFGLAVIYEYQIYKQNTFNALNKLFFVKNYLKNDLATQFLKTHLTEEHVNDERFPFFSEYKALLLQIDELEHDELDEKSTRIKKKLKKTQQQMEAWFAEQLFLKNKPTKTSEKPNSYTNQIQRWLDEAMNTKTGEKLRIAADEAQKTLQSRRRGFYLVVSVSVLGAACMTLGTTYLLSETMAIIPLIATISATMPPAVLLIMAATAGIAYGLLTYNAITDMISNETFQKMYYRLRDFVVHARNNQLTWNEVKMTLATVFLVSLAVALTVCTAGTWWTVAKETAPLFAWLSKVPGFVIGIIQPVVTGITSLFFNVENTTETLSLIENAKQGPIDWLKTSVSELINTIKTLPQRENWWQILNPARFILAITIAPLRTLLFLGHLLSMAVSGDRIPGLPEIISTILGFFSELFEDAHYFIDDDHNHEHGSSEKPSISQLLKEHVGAGHGHSHDNDFPTQVLKMAFEPVYLTASLWDWVASGFKHSFRQAYNKQTGPKHWHGLARGHGHTHHDEKHNEDKHDHHHGHDHHHAHKHDNHHENEHDHKDKHDHHHKRAHDHHHNAHHHPKQPHEHTHDHKQDETNSSKTTTKQTISLGWVKLLIQEEIQTFKQDHYQSTATKNKRDRLDYFQQAVKEVDSPASLERILDKAEKDETINTHRHGGFFRASTTKTAGATFFTHLKQEITEYQITTTNTVSNV